MKRLLSLLALFNLILCAAAWADDSETVKALRELTAAVSQLKNQVQSQQSRIERLEAENRQLRAGRAESPAALALEPKVPGVPTLPPPTAVATNDGVLSPVITRDSPDLTFSSTAKAVQGILPNLGMLADIVGNVSENDDYNEAPDRISDRHLELLLEQDVDPYTHLTANIAYSDIEGHTVELEEAYITRWGLPLDLTLRVGRMYPHIGGSASQHLDALLTVDQPLVIAQLFGPDGYFRTGAELSTFLPLPWEDVTHQVIGGLLEGGTPEDGALFGDSSSSPTLFARLKNSVDFSDDTAFDLGTTFLTGSGNDDQDFNVRAVSFDTTLTHRLDESQRLTFLSELYLQDRSVPAMESEHDHDQPHEEDAHDEETEELDIDEPFRTNPVGWYALADYRFAPRWGVGARYDFTQPVNEEPGAESDAQAITGYLTFFQSEFARIRAQYQYLRNEFGEDNNQVFLQGTFAIGTHKHNIQ